LPEESGTPAWSPSFSPAAATSPASRCLASPAPKPSVQVSSGAKWTYKTPDHMEVAESAGDLREYGHKLADGPPGPVRFEGRPTEAEQQATAAALAKQQAKQEAGKVKIKVKPQAKKKVRVVQAGKVEKNAAGEKKDEEGHGASETEKESAVKVVKPKVKVVKKTEMPDQKEEEEDNEMKDSKKDEERANKEQEIFFRSAKRKREHLTESGQDVGKEDEEAEEAVEAEVGNGDGRTSRTFAGRYPPKVRGVEIFKHKVECYYQALDKHKKTIPRAREVDYWRFVQSDLVEEPTAAVFEIADRWVQSLDTEA